MGHGTNLSKLTAVSLWWYCYICFGRPFLCKSLKESSNLHMPLHMNLLGGSNWVINLMKSEARKGIMKGCIEITKDTGAVAGYISFISESITEMLALGPHCHSLYI